jgi:hypothetical protein
VTEGDGPSAAELAAAEKRASDAEAKVTAELEKRGRRPNQGDRAAATKSDGAGRCGQGLTHAGRERGRSRVLPVGGRIRHPARYTAPGGGARSARSRSSMTAARPRTLRRQGPARTTAERSAWINADDVAGLERGGLIEVGTLRDDVSRDALVVDETLKVAGLPMLDETGYFWFAELLLVDGVGDGAQIRPGMITRSGSNPSVMNFHSQGVVRAAHGPRGASPSNSST